MPCVFRRFSFQIVHNDLNAKVCAILFHSLQISYSFLWLSVSFSAFVVIVVFCVFLDFIFLRFLPNFNYALTVFESELKPKPSAFFVCSFILCRSLSCRLSSLVVFFLFFIARSSCSLPCAFRHAIVWFELNVYKSVRLLRRLFRLPMCVKQRRFLLFRTCAYRCTRRSYLFRCKNLLQIDVECLHFSRSRVAIFCLLLIFIFSSVLVHFVFLFHIRTSFDRRRCFFFHFWKANKSLHR